MTCSASNPDLEEQFKLMAAAEKRWQSQVRINFCTFLENFLVYMDSGCRGQSEASEFQRSRLCHSVEWSHSSWRQTLKWATKGAAYSQTLWPQSELCIPNNSAFSQSWVKDSVWSPAFDAETGFMPGTLLDRLFHFALGENLLQFTLFCITLVLTYLFLSGGWWSGAPLTKRNE